jgi:hypothetical protein
VRTALAVVSSMTSLQVARGLSKAHTSGERLPKRGFFGEEWPVPL